MTGSTADAGIDNYEKYFDKTVDKDTVHRLNRAQNKRRRVTRWERGYQMKLKMTQHNGAMALVVSGEWQDIIIIEESGGFALEFIEKSYSSVAPLLVSEGTQEGMPEECPSATMLPSALEGGSQESTQDTVQDDGLFKRLALLRKSLAAAENVPPYLVFHDKTLREMVARLPVDLQAMGLISGVGQAKLEKYGPAFLDAIQGLAV